MADHWRLIDSGLRPPAQHVALNRALLEARRADEVPSTLRFLRFPRCALIGCDRSIPQEIDPERCRSAGLEIQRRITGGDLMCLDEGQIVWELYLHRRDIGTADLRAVSRRLCHAAAAAVSALGLEARYRSPGEIEVDGRRVSGSAGVFDGDALLFQGTLLVDMDPATQLQASRLPPAARDIARTRMACLKDLLGSRPPLARIKRYLQEAFESEFSIEFGEGELTLSENARYRSALREIDHPDWTNLVTLAAEALPVLQAELKIAAGRLSVFVLLDTRERALREVWFGCDFVQPAHRAFADLEAALRHAPLDRLDARIETFFAGRAPDMPAAPGDFIHLVRLAVRQLLLDRV